MTFPTNSHRAPFGLPVPSDGNRCCVCCLKKQHMLPKISFSKSIRSQLSNAVFHVPSRLLEKKRLCFEIKNGKKGHLTHLLTCASLYRSSFASVFFEKYMQNRGKTTFKSDSNNEYFYQKNSIKCMNCCSSNC